MGFEQKGDRFTEFAREFIRMAKHDLRQAERALVNSEYSDVVMYAQQSSEKIAKSLLEMELLMKILRYDGSSAKLL